MRGYFSPSFRLPRMQWFLVLAATGLAAAVWCRPSGAVVTGPQRSDYGVTKAVERLTETNHLSRRPLDDEISKRALKAFLNTFDPRKLYFYQSDVDEFRKKETLLDDEVKKGRVDFAYEVYKRFLQRVNERVALVEDLLKQDFDFTVDEDLVTDPDVLQYPRDEAEARDRWRKMIKYNLLVAKADKEDDKAARAKILRRYRMNARIWEQTNGDELLEQFLTAITTSFDPHSTYMSPASLENFRILMGLNLEGIGAALQPDDEGYTIISKIIPGGAADKQGTLKTDDRIVSVGQGDSGEMEDVTEMRLNDVVKLIRGKAGTLVRLGVRSKGSLETKIVSITRAKVALEDSAARSVILERGKKPDGSAYRIGWIDLPSFYSDMDHESGGRSVTQDVSRILTDLQTKGIDEVVLDLKFNGGGSLPEAIALTGLFIDHGSIVQVKDADGSVRSLDDEDNGMIWKGPLVVVTSKFSASASEIFAGAIQDYNRGLIIGDATTHGKGTVQEMLNVGERMFRIPNPPNLGALKLTTQQFYRPSGESTQKRGVVPDIVLPSLSNLIGTGEADLDYALEFDRVRSARFASNNMVPSDALAGMKARSEKRVHESPDFVKLQKDIERYNRYKEEKKVPLNEEKFTARRAAEKDAEKEEEKQVDSQNGKKNEVYKDDFYNREVVEIALDYMSELSRLNLARAN